MICGAVLFLMGMAAVPIGVFNIGSVLLCLLGGFLWLTVLLERKTGRKQRMLTNTGCHRTDRAVCPCGDLELFCLVPSAAADR